MAKKSAIACFLVVLPCSLPGTGCSLVGTWRTVSVVPEGASFPVEVVTFDESGAYTATLKDNGKRTVVGRCRAEGLGQVLAVQNDAHPPYRVGHDANGRLILSTGTGGQTVSGILEREKK